MDLPFNKKTLELQNGGNIVFSPWVNCLFQIIQDKLVLLLFSQLNDLVTHKMKNKLNLH